MDPTKRFDERVTDYARHRPTYPQDVVATLERELGLRADYPIADIGSGTGISARLFLDAGYEVFAVEPNAPMRAAAEAELAVFQRFHSVEGTAEATTLAAESVGAIVAAQAFHWFDKGGARIEWQRILRAPGLVILMWNERRVDGPFLEAYEALLMSHGVDYAAVRHQSTASPDVVASFYKGPYRVWRLPNRQVFDKEGLFGRARSSSYVPSTSHPLHDAFFTELDLLWRKYGASTGHVNFEYDTVIYGGSL